MKGAPKWQKPGDTVTGRWKQQLLIWLGYTCHLKTLIETGTCDGGTLGGVYTHFDRCYSIELADYYYNISKERFKDARNIELIHGNSAIELPKLLDRITEGRPDHTPKLFWLDAHSSGGLTANEGDPLAAEIQAIMDFCPTSLVVIDDMPGWELPQVVEAGIRFDGWHREYRTGEVFMHKEGLYTIPPFEG